MTNLTRVTGKIFGETASTTNTPKEIGQFGSAKAGTYNATGDVATIQNLSAWSNGWIDAVTPTQQFPSLPEMTGVHKVLSYQTAYTLQKGVPEWDAGTTYYTGDFAKGVGEGKLYVSKVDSNLNNDLSDTNYWEEFSSGGNSRNIGEIVQSTIPLTDAGLHLLDGSLISGSGSYAAFVTYIAGLVTDYPDLFCTEANWQTSVTNYGACDKFVYDSNDNTVRIPKRTTVHGNLIKSYTNGYDWYRIYSDGWCEQGSSIVDNADTTQNIEVNLLKAFATTNYCLLLAEGSQGYPTDNGHLVNEVYTSRTVSSFYYNCMDVNGNVREGRITWQASGYIDISDYQYSPIYEYLVVATSTKTDIEVDIDQIATDLNGKADVDGSNMVSSVKKFDGEIVNISNGSIASAVALSNTSGAEVKLGDYDVSSFLPVDNYSYEVGIIVQFSSAAANSVCAIRLESGMASWTYAGGTNGSQTFLLRDFATLPVDSNRIITIYYVTNGATATLQNVLLNNYRRIGTNV